MPGTDKPMQPTDEVGGPLKGSDAQDRWEMGVVQEPSGPRYVVQTVAGPCNLCSGPLVSWLCFDGATVLSCPEPSPRPADAAWTARAGVGERDVEPGHPRRGYIWGRGVWAALN